MDSVKNGKGKWGKKEKSMRFGMKIARELHLRAFTWINE